MLKILKQNRVEQLEEAVLIPDGTQRYTTAGGRADHPEDDLDVAQIDEQTKAMYDNVVEKARQEAERLTERIREGARKEAEQIIAQAHQDGKQLREQAKQEGLAEGRANKIAEIEKTIVNLCQGLEQLKKEHLEYQQLYNRELKNLSLAVAERVLSHVLSVQETIMETLVKEAVGTVKDSDWVTVELSDQMSQLVYFLEGELGLVQGKQVKVSAKELPPGACILKTATGTIDASVSTQLKNLKEYFDEEQ